MRALHEQFSDPEIVELGFVTAAFLMLGRLHRAFGVAAMPGSTHDLFHDGTREPGGPVAGPPSRCLRSRPPP